MRHEKGRDLEAREELLELAPDGRLRVGVERRERLVEQEHLRVAGERAREGDALALTARQLSGTSVGEVTDAKAVEVLVGLVAARILDVPADRKVMCGKRA